MEGWAEIEQEYFDDVTERFQMMPVLNIPTKNRVAGEWYQAFIPLSREYSGISPVNFFDRSLVKNLPENIKIGVIDVAFSASIDVFDEEKTEEYLNSTAPDYVKYIAKITYDNHPYKLLIDYAKKAQKYGVIKGILFGKDKSVDKGILNWPDKLKFFKKI